MRGCDFGVHGVVNMASLVADGAQFIIAKASQGTMTSLEGAFLGPTGNRAQLLALDPAKCVRGAYGFLTDGPTGRAQCDFYLSRLGDPEGWLCALDLESHPPTTADPHGTYKAAQAFDFIDRFLSQTGNHPLLVYSNKGGWRGDNSLATHAPGKVIPWSTVFVGYSSTYAGSRLKTVDLSALQYTADGSGLGSWPSWGGFHSAPMMQFTSRCRCGAENVDGDSTNLSRAGLLALTTAGSPPPPPDEPAIGPCSL